MTQGQKLLIWVLLGAGIGYAAIKMTSDDPVKPKVVKSNKTAAVKSGKETFPASDFTAHFEPMLASAPTKNVFKPLVVRLSEPGGVTGDENSNMIPSVLAAGEGNWEFTGMAAIDGVPMALIENTSNGDGVFLKQGEKWKNTSVRVIAPDQLTLAGPDGSDVAIKAPTTSKEETAPAETAPASPFPGLSNLPPGIQRLLNGNGGGRGANAAVDSASGAPATTSTSTTTNNNNNNRNRGRGGGGRGGRGRGGGN